MRDLTLCKFTKQDGTVDTIVLTGSLTRMEAVSICMRLGLVTVQGDFTSSPVDPGDPLLDFYIANIDRVITAEELPKQRG